MRGIIINPNDEELGETVFVGRFTIYWVEMYSIHGT